MKTTIILISKSALPIAQRIRREDPSVTLLTTTDATDCIRIPSYESYLNEHFADSDAYLFIGAMGICVRMIAPYLQDKYNDPAVVCIDSTGKYVIPVVSGHVGRANELARQMAHLLGAEAVITTQSDQTGLWALDLFEAQYGWKAIPHHPEIADPHAAMNQLIARFVQREPTLLWIGVRVPGVEELERSLPSHVQCCYQQPELQQLESVKLFIQITPFLPMECAIPTLHFIPKVWQIGIGLAHQAAPIAPIWEAMQGELLQHHIHPLAIEGFATIDLKREEPLVKQLESAGYPFTFFTADQLKEVEVPSPSKRVEAHVGTPSVAEAAALLASERGELILTKQKGSNYTVAVAIRKGILQPAGHIEIVGAGPGDPELISVRGKRMLEKADLILYAGSLVPRELTFYAKPKAVVRSSASMNLEEQFQLMKQFYDQGKFIVRLHTGDPCIYGAIEEQMNYFDQYGMSYHITPGISSFLAAAAELKSQFTIPEEVQTIILTRGEGRTPMPEREKLHLLARSQSTICLFLSATLAEQVEEELLKEYPRETPVAVCYHLTWKDQRIWRGELHELASIIRKNHLTLTTLIVVGKAIDNRAGVSRLYADEFKHLFRK